MRTGIVRSHDRSREIADTALHLLTVTGLPTRSMTRLVEAASTDAESGHVT
jgi:hypothetical protein